MDLWDRSFVSTSLVEQGQPRSLVAGTVIRLWFRQGDPGELQWNGGCNTSLGTVTVLPGRLAVTYRGSTMMGCDPARVQQDAWLTAFLRAGPAYELDGERLVLSVGSSRLELTAETRVRPAASSRRLRSDVGSADARRVEPHPAAPRHDEAW